MYKQVLDPVSHSLGLVDLRCSAAVVAVRAAGRRADEGPVGVADSLAVAVVVAIAVYGMPFGQALDAGAEGAAFGFFPIMWIVINALWIFNMTVETGISRSCAGRLARCLTTSASGGHGRLLFRCAAGGPGRFWHAGRDLRGDVGGPGLPADQGGGRGTDRRHRSRRLRGDRDPDHHAGHGHGLPKHALSQMVGRQVPFLAFLVPFVLVYVIDGRRGLRDSWPAALVAAACSRSSSSRLQLHLHRAHGYRCLARLCRRAGRLLRVWSPRAHEDSTVPVARPGGPAIAGAAQPTPGSSGGWAQTKDDR